MTRIVVIPVDKSEYALAALRWAVIEIYREGDEFHVIHVQEDLVMEMAYASSSAVAAESMAKIQSEMLQQSQTLLKDLGDMLDSKKIPHKLLLKKGLVKEMICDYCAEVNAGLVVTGSRGLGAMQSLLLGSVSDYLLHHCQCAVVVARQLTFL
eukprot:Lithocolla_globosa_v1_NODE_8382_length_827_cov_21.900259.p1 type:complete len:153 gc:universal NODE_8382_length_827_cov_21.900259:39-497(+)